MSPLAAHSHTGDIATVSVPVDTARKMSVVPHASNTTADAANAAAMEHQMTLRQALKVYRKAVS